MDKKPIIPNWISCQTYNFGTIESKTLISNEKNHEFILLEEISSDLWHIILSSKEYLEIMQWCKKNGIRNIELNKFMKILFDKDMIVYDTYYEKNKVIQKNSQKLVDEYIDFIDKMKEWCYKNKYLYSIFFELTYECNQQCVHCYNPKDMNNIHINIDQYKKIIDDAVMIGCFNAIFSGGEATLNKYFIDMIEYARNKYLSVEIFTNGQVLYDDPNLMKKISNYSARST
jgi:molybdenum cofactor biosynthesis enzyme MoaA